MSDLYLSVSIDNQMSKTMGPIGLHYDDRMRVLELLMDNTVFMTKRMFEHLREVFADILIPTQNIVITNGQGEIGESFLQSGKNVVIIGCPELLPKALRVVKRVIRTTYNYGLSGPKVPVPSFTEASGWIRESTYTRSNEESSEIVNDVYTLETFVKDES